MSSKALPAFCCDAAVPVFPDEETKLHRDENRSLHERILTSFINFAVETQLEADKKKAILASLTGLIDEIAPADLNKTVANSASDVPAQMFAFEGQPGFVLSDGASVLEHPDLGVDNPNNPLSDHVRYVIHLTSRHDFGPVYSHRYFVCPADLHDNWVEITLLQWFAKGKPFEFKAERWDLKCSQHSKFFRLTLRPNLNGREAPPIAFGASIPTSIGGLVASGSSSSSSNLTTPSASTSRGPTPNDLSPLSSYADSASGQTPPHPHANGRAAGGKEEGTQAKSHMLRAQAETFQFSDGNFGRQYGQFSAFDAVDIVEGCTRGSGTLNNKQMALKHVGMAEAGGSVGQYYAPLYQYPNNVEVGHFDSRYPVQDEEYRFRRSNNLDDAYPHAGFPEGGGSSDGYATHGHGQVGGCAAGAQTVAREQFTGGQFVGPCALLQDRSLQPDEFQLGAVQPGAVQVAGGQRARVFGRYDFGGHIGDSETCFEGQLCGRFAGHSAENLEGAKLEAS